MESNRKPPLSALDVTHTHGATLHNAAYGALAIVRKGAIRHGRDAACQSDPGRPSSPGARGESTHDVLVAPSFETPSRAAPTALWASACEKRGQDEQDEDLGRQPLLRKTPGRECGHGGRHVPTRHRPLTHPVFRATAAHPSSGARSGISPQEFRPCVERPRGGPAPARASSPSPE